MRAKFLILFVVLLPKLWMCTRPVCNEPESWVGLTLDNCNEIAIKVSITPQIQLGCRCLGVDLRSVNLDLEH